MNDLLDRLQTALGSSYRIERELGGGGMSRVFLAEERELGRLVVVKVLPPEMAAGVNQDRFRREIQLAARLQHPHIVPLLTAGSTGDLLWYVMPYIEGESLRARLAREGELPVGEAVRVLRDVADALAYAHDKGVVHRDIKPDNVMLSGTHALVTDFGVAKAVTDSTGAAAITSLGMALGTPAYMAPEQAAGDAHVDHRADLYALGALGYELLAGRPPFTGMTAQALLAAHVTQTPERLSGLRPAVPAGLDALIMRCLEKRAADRWQRAAEVLGQLDAVLTPASGSTPTAAQTISSGTAAALRQSHPGRVGLLFGLAALVVLSLTWWLVQRLGLPGWVLPAAAALLLTGLPVVIVAARHERKRLLARTAGLPAAPPSGLAGRLLTLRGALAGGGIAFSGLALGTAAFMGLRLLGIGPFATLVSAGVLQERDRLVVAEFENRTADSTLGASITEAFRIDLSQSRVVRIMESRDVAAALQRMQRAPGAPLDAALAAEVAQREGAAAVVAGEVAPLATGYVLSVRLLRAADGTTLLAGREIAPDAAGIIPAVEQLSRHLREGIGESLRSIRADQPLEQVTTPSLDALRLYSQAIRVSDAGRPSEALRLMEQALARDPGFAMAWRKLAVLLGNAGIDPARQIDAARRAHELRDRLPPREGALASATYYMNLGQRPEAIRAYQELLASWPDDLPARNNLALMLNVEGRHAEAERLLRGTIDSTEHPFPSLFDNLVDAQLFQHEFEAAEATIAAFASQNPDNVVFRLWWSSSLDFMRGRNAVSIARLDSIAALGDPIRQLNALVRKTPRLRLVGRLRDASASSEAALRAASAIGGSAETHAARGSAIDQAAVEGLLLERPRAGIGLLDSLLRAVPAESLGRDLGGRMALTYAELGEGARARAVAEALLRSASPEERAADGDLLVAGAVVAAEAGRWREAIEGFRRARRSYGCLGCLLPSIGTAFERLAEPDSARAAYEEYLARPEYFPTGQEFDLPRVYRRLGELYETRGDRARALDYYSRLAELWRDADAELQPQVARIRRRIGELAGEPRP